MSCSKIMKVIIPVLVCFFLSCSSGEQLSTVGIDESYALEIPAHMQKTDELREDALLQYRNSYRNMYVIAFRAPVEDPIREYQQQAVNIITQYLDKPVITDSGKTQLGELTAFHNSIYGKMETEQVYYDHLTIQSPQYFYEVCVWTRGADRKQRYGEELKKILYSFKPI